MTTAPVVRVPVEDLPQASYHVLDAYGGHIISFDSFALANPEVFLENVNLQARQHLSSSLRVSFHVDYINDPHRLQVEAIHTSFTQRLMYEEMNSLARTDSTFHSLINQVLQEALLHPIHQADVVLVLIEDAPTVVIPPVVVPAADLDDEIAPKHLVPIVYLN